MRVLTVADLHQRRALYDRLAAAVAVHKPDVVCLVGDFLDLDGQGEGLLTPEAAACELADLAAGRECVFSRGNHDQEGWPDFEATWRAIRPDLHALHGSAVSLCGLTILGFPCQMGFSHFCAQGRSLPCPAHETAGWLDPLMERLGAAGRGLWLMHEAPVTELGEVWAVCPEWRTAIERWQPLVTVSGHDHNPTRWRTAIGETVAVNVGQRVYPDPGELQYLTIDFQFGADGSPRLEEDGLTRHGG
jgi:Icc-related predicted phosphoesterase